MSSWFSPEDRAYLTAGGYVLVTQAAVSTHIGSRTILYAAYMKNADLHSLRMVRYMGDRLPGVDYGYQILADVRVDEREAAQYLPAWTVSEIERVFIHYRGDSNRPRDARRWAYIKNLTWYEFSKWVVYDMDELAVAYSRYQNNGTPDHWQAEAARRDWNYRVLYDWQRNDRPFLVGLRTERGYSVTQAPLEVR